MLRILQTFAAHNINDGSNYRAVLLQPNALPAAQPVFIPQPDADSEDSGTYTVEGQTIAVTIKVVDYANRVALIAQLQNWFKRGTLGDLVATYSDDGLDYYKPCRVVNLVQDPEHFLHFTALLNTGWTTWRAVDPDTYTWDLTGTGGSHTVDLEGDDETPLSVTFQLSAGPANGYLYQRFYQLINKADVPALGHGPWCITIDTAALVADNSHKCQVDGGIDASVTTIPYDTVTGTVPNIGTGYVDTEQIRWTGKTGTTSGNLTGVTRGVGGTTAASHLDNAEIKVSRMQANCADLRVFVDGAEVNRWIATPNNASTKVWFNVTLNPGYSLPLRSALDNSSSYPKLFFAVTANVANTIKALPAEGVLVHGTEWIKYVKVVPGPYAVGIVERGVLGTTKQAHAIGDNFQLMEHVIMAAYGNADSVAPDTLDANYDDTKPLFLLTSSDNASWVYDATTAFFDRAGTGRTGGWTPSIMLRDGEVSDFYHIKENADSGNPAMGMKIGANPSSAGWEPELAKILWGFYRSCGVDTTTFTGQKYRSGLSFPALNVGLRKSADGVRYIVIWNEAAPAVTAVWEALGSHSSVSMGNAAWVRIVFHGSVSAREDAYAAFEILTGTLAFVSANLPTGTLLAQQQSGQLELTLTNGANDDQIEANQPMLIGLPLVINGEENTILYNNVNAHQNVILDDEGRAIWLRLQPGDNELTIESVDVGTLEAALSWYRRRF